MTNAEQAFAEPRSSRKNLGDRVLLASWTAVYSLLLFGFGLLKRLERSKVADAPSVKGS